MKPAILILFIMLLLSPALTFAQEDIKQQIIEFTDSTEIMIRNGRKLVVDKTIRGDSKGAMETMKYLKNNIDDDYVLFYPAEELLLTLANSAFHQFLYTAANFEHLLDDKSKYIMVDNVSGQIHEFLSNEIQLIKKDLEREKLDSESREFIQLYIRYYMGEEDNFTLNKSIKTFQKSHPESVYNSFLDLIKNYTSTAYMNFCLGYGKEFLNGNVAQNFNSQFQSMNFELEWFINQLYISLFFQGSVERLHTEWIMPILNYDEIHTPDDDVFSINYGLKLGKSLITTKSINFFPYVSLGNYQMKSQKSVDIPDGEPANLKLTSVFSPGLGAACDINLKYFKNRVTKQTVGKWFIRPNISYDFFVTRKEEAKGGSLFINLSMGVGLGG